MRDNLARRFYSKIDRSGGPGACHPWTASKFSNGYGYFYPGGTGVSGVKKKVLLAHRTALELALGEPLRAGVFACHRCDNRPCCNEHHLFAGTQSDNLVDAVRKGRGSAQRLSARDVLEIRSSSDPPRALAARYGVSRGHISMIRTGRCWRHLK